MNPSAVAAPAISAVGNYRWTMLGLNALLYFSFGVASSSTAALAVTVGSDLHLTSAQLGAVLGSWQLVYVGSALAAGLALDKFGLRRTMSAGALVIGASACARAFATDFPSLMFAVGLFGLGGPMISAGSNKVVSEWFQGPQRGTAMGIAVTAPTIGSVLILALANSVLVPILGGWREAFLASGVVSLLAATAWLIFAREAPRHQAATQQDAPRVAFRDSVVQLMRMRNVQLIMAASLGTFMLNHGLGNWLPSLLASRSFSIEEAGFWAAVSTAIGIPSGMFLPRMVRAGRRRFLLATVGVISALTVVAMAFLQGPPLLVTLCILGITRAGATPVMMLVLMDMKGIGAARTGAAAGLFFTFGEIGGFGGPFLIGVLSGGGQGYALPLVLLAGLQMAIALGALALKEESQPAPRAPSLS